MSQQHEQLNPKAEFAIWYWLPIYKDLFGFTPEMLQKEKDRIIKYYQDKGDLQ